LSLNQGRLPYRGPGLYIHVEPELGVDCSTSGHLNLLVGDEGEVVLQVGRGGEGVKTGAGKKKYAWEVGTRVWMDGGVGWCGVANAVSEAHMPV
jgi:hypothetical protein